MKCYVCPDQDLRWESDVDSFSDVYEVDTFLSCPRCDAFVVVSWGAHLNDVREPNNVIPIGKNCD